VARYDKYEPYAGGFRAPLAADWLIGDINTVIGVGLNGSGAVVKGAGTTGVKGVLVLTKARKAREIVDVMTTGEIVDFHLKGSPQVANTVAPGTNYYAADAGGAVGAVQVAGAYVGHTVEADATKGARLVVRVRGGVVAP